jgi:hypothetical protein
MGHSWFLVTSYQLAVQSWSDPNLQLALETETESTLRYRRESKQRLPIDIRRRRSLRRRQIRIDQEAFLTLRYKRK